MTEFVGGVEGSQRWDASLLSKAEPENSYAEIHQEIEFALEGEQLEEVGRLRTRWNDLSPISVLPAEIFVAIFTILAEESKRSDLDYSVMQHSFYTSEWTSVTRVCRKWRSVALDNPSLWGRLCFDIPKWAEEMLKRAKSAPLMVHFNLKPSQCIYKSERHRTRAEEVRVRALQKWEQIQSLCIEHDDTGSLETSENNLSWLNLVDVPGVMQPAPLLHTFTLYADGRLGSILPDGLFGREAPLLRHLQLMNWTLPWTESFLQPFNRLKTLVIQYQGTIPGRLDQSAQQALSALQFLPHLEFLYLSGVLDVMVTDGLDQPPSSKFPITSLRSLKSLNIRAYSYTLPAILARIWYPSPTLVAIEELYANMNGEDPSRVLRYLDQRLGDDIQFLSFNRSPPHSLTAGTGAESYNVEFEEEAGRYPSRFVYISCRRFDYNTTFQALSLSALTVFKISVVTDANVWRVVGQLKNLRTIDVFGEMLKPLIGFLLVTFAPEAPRSTVQSEAPFFPAFRHFIIRDVGFRLRSDQGSFVPEELRVKPNAFEYCIKARQNFGLGIEHLELFKCVISTKLVENLKKVIGQIQLREDTIQFKE